MTDFAGERDAVTPPREEPGRPGLVTVAVVIWTGIGVVMLLAALLALIGLVLGGADASAGPAPAAAAMVVLAAGGAGVLVGARRLGRGSRTARVVLTIVGAVLAVAGLVQVTFLGVGGVWFVAFAVGAVLLHLPAARGFFAEHGR